METRNHGVELPNGIRDPYNVLGLAPQITPEQARAAVEFARRDKAKADTQLASAVAANDGKADLNALSRTAREVATELAEAEKRLEVAEAYAAAAVREQQRTRLADIGGELRKAREQFAEHYREAALALGRWYLLGSEARRLTTSLADRVNDTVYFPPHLKEVLAEADADINPLPALKDAGYGVMMLGFRTQLTLFPMKENNK